MEAEEDFSRILSSCIFGPSPFSDAEVLTGEPRLPSPPSLHPLVTSEWRPLQKGKSGKRRLYS